MEIDFHLQQKLEQYLDNSLPPVDRLALEQQITEDALLSEELRLQRAINSLLEAGRRIELEQELEHIAQQTPYNPSLWQQPKVWGLIAAVSLLVICALFLMKPQQGSEEIIAQIVEEQWQAYPNRLTSTLSLNNSSSEWRGKNVLTQDSRLLRAMKLYEEEAFQQAFDSLDQLMHIPEVEQTGILFYQGMCLMMTDQFRPAIEKFEQIPNTDQLYYGLSQWHLGLVWLKLNNPLQAKIHLTNALSQPQLGKPEVEKVQHLLDRLPN